MSTRIMPQGQAFALFHCILRGQIDGLPEHICSLVLWLDIENGRMPYLIIDRLQLIEDGTLQVDPYGSLVHIRESYRLETYEGRTRAVLERTYT